ncbi:MAG TPA: RNB domain-containing ribonuclease [Pedococcus sp.]|jgi:exoribonuclease R|nr:RNB domain-containing ribonuclease [Pedococcus sp.]
MRMRKLRVQVPSAGRGDATATALAARFEAIRVELSVPDTFPDGVLAEAVRCAAAPSLPERDETARPFLTIDPPGSMDLDQAMHLERDGAGYRVRYAIADVPAFVVAGGAVDVETRKRGQTIYAPDRRTPLHPAVLGEGAASLLPGQVRPAFVWDLQLDEAAQVREAAVYRAMVRSTDRLDYEGVQRALDSAVANPGSQDEPLTLLREVGRKRLELERRRGGASLPMPEQEVEKDESGHYRVRFRPPLEVEDWNAQISLMAGMAGADLMTRAKIGILRTMPTPDDGAVNRFRQASRALGVEWRHGMAYGEFLRTLDRTNPAQLALIHEATALFRGAGYTPFDGTVPDHHEHAAVAAPYAHVTAPLRRLVDRFALVICEAISQGHDVPAWARQALPSLPQIMAASDKVAGAVERACADAVEAATLQHRVGEVFDAVVVDRRDNGGGAVVQVQDPPVLAKAAGASELGARVKVELVEATVATGTVRFRIVTT